MTHWHGTINGYSNYGCRCILCTEANNVAVRSWRSRRGRMAVHGPRFPYTRKPRHGTRSEYVHYRCRCDDCRQAERDYRRSYRAARR